MVEMGESSGPAGGAGGTRPERPEIRRPRIAAASLLVGYGLLVIVAAVVGLRRQAGMPTAPSWTVLHLVLLLALAAGLLRRREWAWWVAVVLAGVELLLLLPLVTALLGGEGIMLLVPRLDLVLVGLEAAALVAVLILLLGLRSRLKG